MKTKIAVVATLTMLMGLTVGFMIGQRTGAKSEHQEIGVSTSTAGCEAEFQMLVNWVLSDMQGGSFAKFPFPIIARKEIEAKGFTDPMNEIIEDLDRHPNLIPYPGELGGTMAFSNARVLSPDRVLALFDDGHIGGWALLGFEVKGRGEIGWKLVYASEDSRETLKSKDWLTGH